MFRAKHLYALFSSTEIGQQQNNMKRFYKQAHLKLNDKPKHPLHQHLLLLDGRTIKTPYQNPLALPSQRLGFLVVSEFNRQVKFIKSGQMPLLALCRTAVDADIQGHLSPHMHHSIYEYLKTDTLLFPDESFQEEYNELVTPLVTFFGNKFNMKLQPSNSISPPGVTISQQFRDWLQGLNSWQLIGLEQMVSWMRSTIAGVALAHEVAGALDIQRAAYLQEAFQMRASGEVEEKLMEINQIRLMVSCGQILYRFGKPDSQDSQNSQ